MPDEIRRRLFGCAAPDIAAFELVGTPDGGPSPDEERHLATASSRRLATFRAGRQCAHAALRELGVAASPLPARDDGPPQWPPGVTGSIAHTDDFALAVATRTRASAGVSAIGVDVESVGAVTEDVFGVAFTRRERTALAAVPPDLRAHHATIAFAAKEALYKAQYMLTGAWLDFCDVEVVMTSDGTGEVRYVSPVRHSPTSSPVVEFGHATRGAFGLAAVVMHDVTSTLNESGHG